MEKIRILRSTEEGIECKVDCECGNEGLRKIAHTAKKETRKGWKITNFYTCDSCNTTYSVETGRKNNTTFMCSKVDYLHYASVPVKYEGNLSEKDLAAHAKYFKGEITPEDEELVIMTR